ncbi:MAG: ATP-binding protein [Planctomycetaceae bacterium]
MVLDELGYVPAGKAGAELLLDVLSTPCERQSLIVITNLPFEQWTDSSMKIPVRAATASVEA